MYNLVHATHDISNSNVLRYCVPNFARRKVFFQEKLKCACFKLFLSGTYSLFMQILDKN